MLSNLFRLQQQSDNTFLYKIHQQEAAGGVFYIYTEYFNDKQISELTLNELEWLVLKICSDEIVKMDELIHKINEIHHDVLSFQIETIVENLHEEKLIYVDDESKELFSIIDADKFDRI